MKLFYKLAILACAVVSLAAQPISPIDSRIEGVWKLSSERIESGSIDRLPVGSVMTATQAGDHLIVNIREEGGKVVTSAISGGGPVRLNYHFSADAKTLTQTINGNAAHTGRPYSVTRVWQRQVPGPKR